MSDDKRCTGRTTRMLRSAIANLLNGQNVAVVMHHLSMVDSTVRMLYDLMRDMGYYPKAYNSRVSLGDVSIAVLATSSPSLNMRTLTIPGYYGVILFDHHALEVLADAICGQIDQTESKLRELRAQLYQVRTKLSDQN